MPICRVLDPNEKEGWLARAGVLGRYAPELVSATGPVGSK